MFTKQNLFGTAAIISILTASCIPDEPTGSWSVGPGYMHQTPTGASPGVLVVGDSLVYSLGVWGTGPTQLAGAIQRMTNLSTLVAAQPGASLSHFMKKSLMSPNYVTQAKWLNTLPEYVVSFKPRLTVISLGTNDAKLLHETRNAENSAYLLSDYQGSLRTAIQTSLSSSKCVLLVNVADHNWSKTSSPDVAKINNEIKMAADGNPSRVRRADWYTYSRNQNSWFISDNEIHLKPEGNTAYLEFIRTAVRDALNNGC